MKFESVIKMFERLLPIYVKTGLWQSCTHDLDRVQFCRINGKKIKSEGRFRLINIEFHRAFVKRIT